MNFARPLICFLYFCSMKISVNKNDNVTMTPVVNENIFVVIGLIFKDSEYVADFSINHVTMFVGRRYYANSITKARDQPANILLVFFVSLAIINVTPNSAI